MIAVCPGSFDPVTNGHLDIIARAARIFGDVIVAVGHNSAKSGLFGVEDRVAMVEAATAHLDGVRVLPMTGLVVDFCALHGADVIVKGIRFASDLDYELQMVHVNAELTGIDTVLLPASREWGTISSTMVRDVARNGGDISAFVPGVVTEFIAAASRTHEEGTHG